MFTQINGRGEKEIVSSTWLDVMEPNGERWKLEVKTSKSHAGYLRTYAQAVCQEGSGFIKHTMMMFSKNPLESDFSMELAKEKVRCTQKAMETQHQTALIKHEGLQCLAAMALEHQTKRKAFLRG